MTRKVKAAKKKPLKVKKDGKSLFKRLKSTLMKAAAHAKILYRNYINQSYINTVLKLWPLKKSEARKLPPDMALKLDRSDFEFLKRSKMLLRYPDGTWAIRGFSKFLEKPKSYKKQTWAQWGEDHFPRFTKQEVSLFDIGSFNQSARRKLTRQFAKGKKAFAQLGYMGIGFAQTGMVSVGVVGKKDKVDWVYTVKLTDIKNHHIIVKKAPEQKMVFPSVGKKVIEDTSAPIKPFKMPKGEGIKGQLTPIQKKEVELRKFIQSQSQHYTFSRFAAPFLNKWLDSYAKKPTMTGLKVLARFVGQQNRYKGFKRYSYPFLRKWINELAEMV